jgi:hypothetical protein
MAKRQTKTRKPNAAKLETSWNSMDKAYGRLKSAERAVLRLFYDAGNKKWASFRAAVKEAAIVANRPGGQQTGFSNKTIEACFRDFDGSTHK